MKRMRKIWYREREHPLVHPQPSPVSSYKALGPQGLAYSSARTKEKREPRFRSPRLYR